MSFGLLRLLGGLLISLGGCLCSLLDFLGLLGLGFLLLLGLTLNGSSLLLAGLGFLFLLLFFLLGLIFALLNFLCGLLLLVIGFILGILHFLFKLCLLLLNLLSSRGLTSGSTIAGARFLVCCGLLGDLANSLFVSASDTESREAIIGLHRNFIGTTCRGSGGGCGSSGRRNDQRLWSRSNRLDYGLDLRLRRKNIRASNHWLRGRLNHRRWNRVNLRKIVVKSITENRFD